uniref:Adhesion G protein-coupled receptor L4 n=1 Tax=Esox lucius TaxID=8010 RepID=A0A3P8YSS7_ESOLU
MYFLFLLIAWLSSVMGRFSNICDTCHRLASCKAMNGSNACYCNHGYTGDGTNFCNDDNECQNVTYICGNNSKCTNTEGSYYCTCGPGYISTGLNNFRPNDGTECTDVDECKNAHICGPFSHCHNTKGSFFCNCQRDYISTSGTQHFHPDNGVRCKGKSLMQIYELVAWKRIKQEHRDYTITKLLHTVEESTLILAKNYETTTEIEIYEREMEMKLYSFDVHQRKKTMLSVFMGGDHVHLHPKRLEGSTNGSVAIVFLRYENVGDILKPNTDPGVTEYTSSETGEITVNSQVIAAAIKPADMYQLDHVTFTLRHTVVIDVTKCAFWEYDPASMKGHWATQGCEQIGVNSTTTTCSCNHLTHFAILMSSGRANMAAHYNILTRITQLGMIISIICLSMCIFTFWFFSEIQSTRTTIHKNLCCSLFMAEFIFLVGINMNTHKLFCSIIAGLLHYFFLAAFAWMCIEGIHLYLIVVGVIYNKGFLHRNFYIFGYGSPAVVVAISATLGSKYYGTNKLCWLSTENNFIWSFIGPACLIILVNLLAFGVIIYKVYRHTAVKKPEISHYKNIRSCARGALALLFVLGATWTFGVLHILNETTLTAYLFTIANAFQGMFIFIFLCVLSRKIQEEYYRLFKNVPCCFDCLR